MTFTLPDLLFDTKSFEPFMSEETFEYHYGKHHAKYVDKLNSNISGTKYEGKPLEEVIKESAKDSMPAVFNNAAQHFNHSFFWNSISPQGIGKPKGKILDLIDKEFGAFESFQEQFSDAATTLFGSGWTWLVLNSAGGLEILKMSNAGTPVTEGKKPLLTIDVWEHAYYIDHRNARPAFIKEFWKFVNWDFVNKQLM